MHNGTLFQFFHWYYPADGSLWKFLAKEAPRLAALGITAIWMPPAFKGSKGADSEGYDVYDLYDLGEFDQQGSIRTKYGTKEEYLQAIGAVHAAGMQAYADVILNHLCGADGTEQVKVKKANPANRYEFISDEQTIEAYTRFSYPARQGRYSSFVWDQHCFTGVDMAKNTQEKAVFKLLNEYGEQWEEVADHENGNYDFLLGSDIEFRNKAVREELRRWGAWYQQSTKIDGLRLDAVKHIAPDYLNRWVDQLRQQAGKDLFVVGEYWAPEKLQDMLHFIDITEGRMALFDACLHHNLYQAASGGKDYDLRRLFDSTLVTEKPSLAVTLTGNHDTQPLQLLEAPLQAWFLPLAYALILLRDKGYPCVFFPDLYGAQYKGNDNNGEEREVTLKPVPALEQLLRARKSFAYGVQRDYFDYPSCIGWVRAGDAEHPGSGCAVLLSNSDKGQKRMEIGQSFAGQAFHDWLGHSSAKVVIGEDGWGDFMCEAGSVSVWVAVKHFARPGEYKKN
jgi:alpha-amylase